MGEIVLQTNWGWKIALYLFLGGLAAGTLCTVAIIKLVAGGKYRNTIRFGAWAGASALAIGVAFLLLEVGVPFRAIILFRSFVNFDSWMAFGAWFLLLGLLFFGLFALSNTDWVTLRFKLLSKVQIALAIIVIPLSLGIAAYTGVLLGVLWAHPLWNTWFLPALFTVSAMDTGVALVSGYALLREQRSEGVRKALEISTVTLVLLEGSVLGSYLGTMLSGSDVAALSARALISGPLSGYFWFVVVGLGLVTPLLVSTILIARSGRANKTKYVLPMLGILGCLTGGLALRIVVLLAGVFIYS